MSGRDPYQVLGIGVSATAADVGRAYRRLARAVHPDSRPGDPFAAAEFRAVCDAYGLLSDPGRRAAWDRLHQAGHPGEAAPAAPPAGPAPRPFPYLTVARETADPLRGAVLRAGPVSIEPSGLPGSSGPQPTAGPAGVGWLACWLLAGPRRPW